MPAFSGLTHNHDHTLHPWQADPLPLPPAAAGTQKRETPAQRPRSLPQGGPLPHPLPQPRAPAERKTAETAPCGPHPALPPAAVSLPPLRPSGRRVSCLEKEQAFLGPPSPRHGRHIRGGAEAQGSSEHRDGARGARPRGGTNLQPGDDARSPAASTSGGRAGGAAGLR